MKLKIIKNNKLCKKEYLQQLITLYKQILQALFLIIKDQEPFPKQFFSAIAPGIQTQGRQRKKEAERNFFTQTFNLYSNYKKLRKVMKKYQVYMRFCCISEILLQKFQCLIQIKDKTAFIKQYQETTDRIKEKIYSWMKVKRTNQHNQSHSFSNLKYICSNQLTLPSTTASRIGSGMAKMYERYFNLESIELTNNETTHLQQNFDESIHFKKKQRCITASLRKQKTKVEIGKPFKKGKKLIRCPSAPAQRKIKKQQEIVTEKQKGEHKYDYKRRPLRKNAKYLQNNENELKIKENQVTANANAKDKKELKGRTSIHNNIADNQSEQDDEKTKLQQTKKSDYYSSQNYMSRKTLESGFGGIGKLKRMASLNTNIDFAYGTHKTKTHQDDTDQILQSRESIGSGAHLRNSHILKHKKLLSGSEQSISIEDQNQNIQQDNNILQSQVQTLEAPEHKHSRNSGRLSKLKATDFENFGPSKFNQSEFKKQNNKKQLDPEIQRLRQMEAQFKKYSTNSQLKEDIKGICSYLKNFQKECKEQTYYEHQIKSSFFKQQHHISEQQRKAKERYYASGGNKKEFIARQILLDQTKQTRNDEEYEIRRQLFQYSQNLPFKKASKHQLIQIELISKQDRNE